MAGETHADQAFAEGDLLEGMQRAHNMAIALTTAVLAKVGEQTISREEWAESQEKWMVYTEPTEDDKGIVVSLRTVEQFQEEREAAAPSEGPAPVGKIEGSVYMIEEVMLEKGVPVASLDEVARAMMGYMALALIQQFGGAELEVVVPHDWLDRAKPYVIGQFVKEDGVHLKAVPLGEAELLLSTDGETLH